jgi:FtsH-binding integral membrane protein
MDLAANIIGMMGTILVVGTFFLLQLDKLDPKGFAYNFWNFVGAVLLLLSLLVHFNLASLVIEVFWIAASLVGLVKFYKNRKNQKLKAKILATHLK